MIHKIKALYDEGRGSSLHAIAKALGISRNTVRKYLAMSAEAIAADHGQRGRVKRLDAHRDAIVHLLATYPRLEDGTPFPTTFYLTCPRATAAVSTLEAEGVLAEMSDRLQQDSELASRYWRAHEHYLAARRALGGDEVPEISGISAGGMPERAKCLHVLVGHALAAGRGVNPLGDEALDRIGEFWARPCLDES